MRFVGIEDLVLDYYYADGKLLAVDGGMSVPNIIANLSKLGLESTVIGACGNDILGTIALDSLKELGVDTTSIETFEDIRTRAFHIIFNGNSFISKRKCPLCGEKKWYNDNLMSEKDIISKINDNDILIFSGLSPLNIIIINNCSNRKLLDLGYANELINYTDEEIIKTLSNHFDIININENVANYFAERFPNQKIYNADLVIITHGKNGADFIYKGKEYNMTLEPTEEVDANGAGDAFFSSIINSYYSSDKFDVEEAYKKATELTSLVVSKLGARGHLHDLYEVEKDDDNCTCKVFKLRKKPNRL